MRAEQAGLQPDGLLKQASALVEPLLLKSNGAEHGMGGGSRVRIGERRPYLRVCFLQPSLLDQHRGLLERLASLELPWAAWLSVDGRKSAVTTTREAARSTAVRR